LVFRRSTSSFCPLARRPAGFELVVSILISSAIVGSPAPATMSSKLSRLATDRPVLSELRRHSGKWVKPELVVGVRHLRGKAALQQATVQRIK
jgi:hypothetical protein